MIGNDIPQPSNHPCCGKEVKYAIPTMIYFESGELMAVVDKKL